MPDKKANDDRPTTPTQNEGLKPRDIPGTSGGVFLSPRAPGNMSHTNPSPPSFVSVEELIQAAQNAENMKLVHEIVVDQDFKIENLHGNPSADNRGSSPLPSIEQQVTEVVKKAFWDALLDDITKEQPPKYEHLFHLLNDVKTMLLSILLPQHGKIERDIQNILDVNRMQEEVEDGKFDILFYTKYCVDLVGKLCAPVRDELVVEIRAIDVAADIANIVPFFRRLIECLELMKMDMANFTIQQMRPLIQQNAVQYERKRFKEIVDSRLAALRQVHANLDDLPAEQRFVLDDGLLHTRKWIDNVYNSLGGSASSSDTASAALHTPQNLMNVAFVELLFFNKAYNYFSFFPETLTLDFERMLAIACLLERCIFASTAILVAHSVIGSRIEGVQKIRERMKAELLVLSEKIEPLRRSQVLSDMSGGTQEAPIAEARLAVKKELIAEIFHRIVAICDEYFVEASLPAQKLSTEIRTELEAQLTRALVDFDAHGAIADATSATPSVWLLLTTRMKRFLVSVMQPRPTADGASTSAVPGQQQQQQQATGTQVQLPQGLTLFHPEIMKNTSQFIRCMTHNRAVFAEYYATIINQVYTHNK